MMLSTNSSKFSSLSHCEYVSNAGLLTHGPVMPLCLLYYQLAIHCNYHTELIISSDWAILAFIPSAGDVQSWKMWIHVPPGPELQLQPHSIHSLTGLLEESPTAKNHLHRRPLQSSFPEPHHNGFSSKHINANLSPTPKLIWDQRSTIWQPQLRHCFCSRIGQLMQFWARSMRTVRLLNKFLSW